jgi:hypothetical protein
MTTKKIIFAIILLGILTLTYVWFFVYNKSHADFQSMKPSFSGNATELYEKIDDQFMENFREKAVEVKGALISIEGRSAIMEPGVQIRIHDDAEIPEWEIGDIIAVKCRVVGTEEDILTGEILLLCDQCMVQ